MEIRDARPQDADAIAAIYNDAVAHSTAIWNDSQVDSQNRSAWMLDRQRAGFPVLVACGDDGAVLGYASFGEWRSFSGYRHTVEHSVHIRAGQRGKGLGRALMLALIEHARAMGMHAMIGAIEAGNTASIGLHETLGFQRAGLMKEVGAKFGTWLDLVFMQLLLDRRARPDDGPV